MNKLTITITITDPEVLEDYEHFNEDSFRDDLYYHLQYLLDVAEIEVEKEG